MGAGGGGSSLFPDHCAGGLGNCCGNAPGPGCALKPGGPGNGATGCAPGGENPGGPCGG